ncbi:RIOK3-like protein [Mya arenaria]|uniref:Serine/threonine-protein kinase RIO3 n=1 Tax=Mya arenaria TaxID=6604 RepID=A0ABY7F7W7_MYAAR|nr:RIOK3-like protein [Mya arenaria]
MYSIIELGWTVLVRGRGREDRGKRCKQTRALKVTSNSVQSPTDTIKQTETLNPSLFKTMEGIVTETTSQPKPSSPWGKPAAPVACSLEDVMSEQLASDLQQQDLSRECRAEALAAGIDIEPDIQDLINSASNEAETGSDVALARLLQIQYDQEHNALLQAQEKHWNGTNKVRISYENYQCPHPAFREDEDPVTVEDDYEEKTEWEKDSPVKSAKGYIGKGKNITTKHDPVICGRRNASRIMDFPPDFVSGDGEGMDMMLPNHVYNALKRHSVKENHRNHKLHDKKEHSTTEHAMDPRTRLLLYRLVNNGILESISGSISTGKESVVFHAYGGQIKDQSLPTEVAIKVFKTTLNEFKNRERYVHGDHRFAKDDYKKQNPRKIIKMWAMKECANLSRMRKFSIPCPEVQVLKKHVLVMSFIGSEQRPAPKLKDAKLSTENWEDAYQQVVQFFMKCGVHKVLSAERMFNKVTKLDIHGQGSDFVSQVT